VKTVWWPLATA